MASESDRQRRRAGISVFLLGLAISLGAALLLFLGLIESGWATVLGIVGIGLITTSRAVVWTHTTPRR